jgi:hypothetical protein
MKTTMAAAIFIAFGASAAGVGAFVGSDTLNGLTRDILGNDSPFAFDCGGDGNTPAGGLFYDGTGSINGEAATLYPNSSQQIAPMTRMFLNNMDGTQCIDSDPTHVEGIVHSLDGIVIVANNSNFGTTACNGSVSLSCAADTSKGLLNVAGTTITPDPTRTCSVSADCNVAGVSGEVCQTGVCRYVINSWKDVLRIVFAGMSVPGDRTLADRNCASPERKFMASNWNSLFQANTCVAGGVCSSGIKHVFRPADVSGTADTFALLLDLPPIDLLNESSPFCNAATKGHGTMTATTFILPAAADANSGPMPAPPAGFAPIPPPTAVGGADVTKYRGPYFTDLQDGDVIRRPCDGTGISANTIGEDVCSARGDLGLVLPIWDAPADGPETAFPSNQCDTGLFIAIANELKVNGCSRPAACFSPCPNGVLEGVDPNGLLSAGTCAYPAHQAADGTLDPRCYNTKGNKLAGEQLPTAPNNVDGRVYNLHAWIPAGGQSFMHASVPRATGHALLGPPALGSAFMVGAYYRLHYRHSNQQNQGGAPVFCKEGSATEQMGCLVQASPCSIAVAGRPAGNVMENGVQNAAALKLNGLDPAPQCIRNLIASSFFPAVGAIYPLARRLFLNTVKGFDQVTGDERKLALCYQNRSLIDPFVQARGLITLSPTASERPAYCADFFDHAFCNNTPNVDACKNHVAGSPFPKCEEGEDPATCH